jgi:N6-L-threonylcarbamoyladenine synthase
VSEGFRGTVLGIETSCDETSAAVVRDGRLLGHVILSQDGHERFGGVVPEIAARAHLRQIDAVVEEALREAGLGADGVDAVGVTAGPGLVGALLVGVNWAKAFAFGLGRPLIGVHHMEAHLFANSLEAPDARPPFVALLVSGGHTLLLHAPAWGRYRLLGETRDDAAGEAFDKVARRLGLGFPGGPEIARQATRGTPGRYRLPRPMIAGGGGPGDPAWFDFSFSGLKTAVALLADEVERGGGDALSAAVPDLAAEFQDAIVETLVTKTMRAVEFTGCRRVLLGGGVARNALLRERLAAALAPDGELHAPSPRLATDNAAMVARLAEHRLASGERSGLDLNADPSLPFPGLVRERVSGDRSPNGGTTCIPS